MSSYCISTEGVDKAVYNFNSDSWTRLALCTRVISEISTNFNETEIFPVVSTFKLSKAKLCKLGVSICQTPRINQTVLLPSVLFSFSNLRLIDIMHSHKSTIYSHSMLCRNFQ